MCSQIQGVMDAVVAMKSFHLSPTPSVAPLNMWKSDTVSQSHYQSSLAFEQS